MEETKNWYQTPIERVFEALETSSGGLSTRQAEKRLQEYGYNELKEEKRGSLIRFLAQFNNPLLYVLIAAAVLTAVLGHYIDTYVITGVVLATVVIGFIQEGKAEASLAALKSMMVPQCVALRDGEKRTVQTRDLVPGDVVVLESGDRVPADLRLFSVRHFYVDEAALTGESKPVEKHTDPLPRPNLPPSEQRSMAFGGSFVTRGRAEGVVVATGEKTEMGKIAGMMTETKRGEPPIVRKIGDFTKFILGACLGFGVIILVLGVLLGYELGYMLLATAGILVALIPEGLPAAIITAFAVGSMAMARRNALIRRLPAAETLGATTVICSDKTGTLTRNEMTVVRVFSGGRLYHLTGVGYDPKGDFFHNDQLHSPMEDEALSRTLTAGFLCNNAELVRGDRGYGVRGDPTEGALIVSAAKAGITAEVPQLDEIPFEPEHQYMATLHRGEDGNVMYVKGSPERVSKMCSDQFTGTHTEPLAADSISRQAREMASDALRVLAMAYKRCDKDKVALDPSDMQGLTFLGLQGMIDPPRQEAIEAIKKCRKAGIKPVMITGDHMATARAVAQQLGIIEDEEEVLTGEQLSAMNDNDLYEAVEKVSVYARTAPEHKYRITKQLQRRGHIVAMTGDGVNDAPALKAADIGVAMGITGTEVSKEAADMVLTDDNFASIVAAVEEGRHIFNNIWKVILYLLPTNGGQGLVLIAAILLSPFILVFGERLPMEPVQVLWVNLVVAIGFGIPLIWEPKDRGLLDRPPRNPEEKLYNPLFLRRVGIVSLLSAAAAGAMFLLFVNRVGDTEESLSQAQTAAFTTLIFVQLFYLFTARKIYRSVFTFNPFSNRVLVLGAAVTVGLQLMIVYSEPLFGVSPFRTLPFPALWWLPVIAVSLGGLLIVEIEKIIERRTGKDSYAEF
ncbi:MAG: HAD-IC family P-type ATPase [Dehalococcoidia bacterium]|nr:HAD-IC family P-type ATPase [Dehalococcoidia bacterium]